MQNLLYSPPHANSTISDQVISTYSASQRRGLLCSEYPLDSKERTDNQLNSPFRLSNEDKSATKKKQRLEYQPARSRGLRSIGGNFFLKKLPLSQQSVPGRWSRQVHFMTEYAVPVYISRIVFRCKAFKAEGDLSIQRFKKDHVRKCSSPLSAARC